MENSKMVSCLAGTEFAKIQLDKSRADAKKVIDEAEDFVVFFHKQNSGGEISAVRSISLFGFGTLMLRWMMNIGKEISLREEEGEKGATKD